MGGNASSCQDAADGLGLANVEVVHGRAETWTEGLGQMEVVTARALAPLDVVAEYAAPLLSLEAYWSPGAVSGIPKMKLTAPGRP